MFSVPPVRYAIVAAFGLGCVACATPQWDPNNTEPREDPVYRTGSHIPIKDPASSPSKTMDTQSVQDALRQGQQRAVPPPGR